MPLSIRGGANNLTGTEDKEFFIRKMLVRATPKLLSFDNVGQPR